jgi:pyruvate dehydrogenase complex dehydrogenase (E1) component
MQEPYENLANAIVVQACNDYRAALDGIGYDYKPADAVIKELEKFFRSSRFRMLTKVKGEYLMERLKQEHQEKLRKEKLCKSL